MNKIFTRNIILSLVFILAFSSCEVEYEIDTTDYERSLVVNSLFSHDRPWSISVTNSKNLLDNEDVIDVVDNASVEIYNNNGEYLYDLYLDEEGNYSNEDRGPSYGQCYSVKVSASNFETVVAKDKVPQEGTLTINKTFIKDEKDNIIDTEISFFIGKQDQETYLVWELYTEEEIGEEGIPEIDRNLTNSWLNELYKNPRSIILGGGSTKVEKTFDGNVTTTLNTLLLLDEGGRHSGLNIGNSGIITNNDQLSRTKKLDTDDLSEVLPLNLGSGEGTDAEDTDGGDEEVVSDKFELRVMTISKELHDYYKSVEEYYKFNPTSTVVQPSKVHSNVKNGYGMFAGYHEKVVTF